MAGFREQAAEGLHVGDSFKTSRIFTAYNVSRFALISRDYNPVHLDARFAKARDFGHPICHGLLAASRTAEIGGQVGWPASALDFRFEEPVYFGETITCEWVITALDHDGRAKASVTMAKEDGVAVIEAEISDIVPGVEERTGLKQMLSEGDSTNGLTNKLQSGATEDRT